MPWLYRFNAQLDWLTLRHHGLTEAEQRDLSLRLARAMPTLYEPARAELTRVLELYRELGDRRGEAATRHQLARIDEAMDE